MRKPSRSVLLAEAVSLISELASHNRNFRDNLAGREKAFRGLSDTEVETLNMYLRSAVLRCIDVPMLVKPVGESDQRDKSEDRRSSVL